MKTLNITISDVEYGRFGIPNEQLNFTDFVDLISRELMRQNLIPPLAASAQISNKNSDSRR